MEERGPVSHFVNFCHAKKTTSKAKMNKNMETTGHYWSITKNVKLDSPNF